MNNNLKVILTVLAVVILVVVVASIVLIVIMHPNQQNTNTNPIVTTAPTATSPSINTNFSLLTASGSAMQVESANPIGNYILTNPLEFIYEPTHTESFTFEIQNDGNVPIVVTAQILTQNVPAYTNVFISSFYLGTEQTPSTQDSVTVGVGQSTTVTFTTTLTPNNPPTQTYMQGLSGVTYNFKLQFSSTQAS